MPKNTLVPAPVRLPEQPSMFDLSGLGHVPIIPLVPVDVLKRRHVFVPTDLRFRAAARLLQSLWREDRELPIGTYVDGEGKRRRLGSRINDAAGRLQGNFMSVDIAQVVRRECIYRELGALIEVDRLRTNLLSSMPLTFNVFAPLKRDLTLATRFVAELLPGVIKEVTSILFEHSPGRGNVRYTGDYTAFDLLIRGLSPTGHRIFIAIEVKYSESGNEPLPSRISPRHLKIAAESGIFVNPDDPNLFTNPHQQLVREHCLAQSMLDNGLADAGVFMLIAPELNHQIQGTALSYAEGLAPPEKTRVPFINITLECVLEAVAAAGLSQQAAALHRRYCDWWLVDGELELGDSERPSPIHRAKTKSVPVLDQAS